ncbi:MAG TPA: 2TM domain-containing protein [Fimbriimonadaceae bacterium]|nr:2TM domain-containing protein [Fimbriimonadaceae bacterium]
MQRFDYEEHDVQEILKRAISIDATTADQRAMLERTAAELGISGEALQRAEREYLKEREEQQDLREFVRHYRGTFWSHLCSYAIVNSFLFFIDLKTGSGVGWFWWPLLGWGLGLAFHAASVFNPRSSEFVSDYEKWKKKKAKERKKRGATT